MPSNSRQVSRAIEKWFAVHARDLPWRRTLDPYAIWISEVMLQQTQVKTVIPYWERWLNLFPGVRALAGAPEQSVLKAWEGLGYYSRARNLQKAARMICSEHGGAFPRSHQAILSLPGIGRYTAGAICSIAFGQPTPILDGNVARVLSRMFLVDGVPGESGTQKELWSLSQELVESARDCSALNQGLMELGATVCLPRTPNCSQCPVRRNCGAYRTGRVEEFPPPRIRPEMRQREFVALLIHRRGEILIRKRANGVVNGGLWEFPNFEGSETQIKEVIGLDLPLEPAKTIRHTITRNRITVRAWRAAAPRGTGQLARKLSAEWWSLDALQALPFSSAHAKLRTFVQETFGKPNPVSAA